MFKRIEEDFSAIFTRDPAARSRLEIFFCYPGFQALQLFRLSSWLWKKELKLVGRFLTYLTRMLTGIEIHPGATIGKGFFIDHGMGVVIGETAVIGDNVTLYHDVTLGGVSPTGNEKGAQRHPTVKDGVIVGAGAQLLGCITVGENARIGSNAVVIRDVEAGEIMVGVPAHRAKERRKGNVVPSTEFEAYANCEEVEDPVQNALKAMQKQVEALQKKIHRLEAEQVSGTKTTKNLKAQS